MPINCYTRTQLIGLPCTKDRPYSEKSISKHTVFFHKKQTLMHTAGFEATMSASLSLHKHVSDRAASVISDWSTEGDNQCLVPPFADQGRFIVFIWIQL